MKVKQLEKTGLKAKVAFSTSHPTLGHYFAITIDPPISYVKENGEITSKLTT